MKTKKILMALLVPIMLSFVSCSYDDTEIRNRVDDLDDRLTKLEETVKEMNKNLGSLMTVVEALRTDDRIESVTPLEDGTGYTITFSKSGTITILHGKGGADGTDGADGADGQTPVVTIGKWDDGNYYWKVNGEWLLVDGNMVPATSKAETPQIRVNEETGNFELSFDGTNWQSIGSAGGAGIFKDVIDGEDEVTFILSGDKDPIVIPKVQTFALNVDSTTVPVDGPGTISVKYTVTSADEGTVVEAIGTGGIVIESVQTNIAGDYSSGSVMFTIPDDASMEGKVFIFAVNSKGTTSTRILSFEEGIMDVMTMGELSYTAEGGELTLFVMTNYNYTVETPEWITYQITKAVREEFVVLTILENTDAASRTGNINLVDGMNVRYYVTVTQEGLVVDEPGYKGPIEDWKDDGSVDF